MKILREIFGETGDLSMMRVLCFMSMCTAIVLAFQGKDAEVVIFVGAAMGGKVSQKYIENSGNESDTSSK
jgi:hypothetical protein